MRQVTLDKRSDISLDAVRAVAWHLAQVRFSPHAIARMGEARRAFMAMLDDDPDAVVYGVTSGYGSNAKVRLSADARLSHARRPPGSLGAFGAGLPDRTVRAIVLARLANFIDGHAAITPALAEGVAAMLDAERMPPVPWQGQGGAGEILALAPLFVDLAETVELGEKDALSLINGSPCAAALVADAALIARRRLDLAYLVFALSIEAMNAPLEAYDAAFDDLWDDPHERMALVRLRALIAGASGPRRPYQAPVSWRILPRLLGLAERAVAAAETAATTSLRSVTDNPVYLMPTPQHPFGRAVSNGGYHNAMAWPALDGLAGIWAEFCLVADRHTTKLHEARVSLLPEKLTLSPDAPFATGILGMVQVGFGEEARHAAQRSFMPATEGGGYDQNDLAPPTFLAWDKEARAGDCLMASLAMLAVTAAQALFVADRAPAPPLVPLLDEVRRAFPPVTGRRRVGPEIGALADQLRRIAVGEDGAAGFGLSPMAGG